MCTRGPSITCRVLIASEGFVPNDLAVIVLDENVADNDYGGVLATLPALGALDTQEGTELTAISYGPQEDAPCSRKTRRRRTSCWQPMLPGTSRDGNRHGP